MRAITPKEVGERLLPHVTRIIGGQGSALVDADGDLLGVDGISPEAVGPLLAATDGQGGPEVIRIPLRSGRLVVQVTPYTPYFARSETELLDTLATFTDLALSRAELSERERQTAIELQVANEAMREFVAIASHDLRTPVTVIKGFATALESDGDNIPIEQRQQFLGTIRRHADHLSVIIDDLLTTSRLDAGVIEPTAIDVDLGPFLRRLAGDLAPEEPVIVDVPDGLHLRVDPEHLQRMVTNYLVNAFRYGAPPVTLRARQRTDDVEILVCDQGPGVPHDFASRAFEKFARVDKRHSRETQGTGLGLAIVRGLARASGGDAWFTPNEPKGACFGIRLPLAGPQ
jgi:signal transduction histidine kinase